MTVSRPTRARALSALVIALATTSPLLPAHAVEPAHVVKRVDQGGNWTEGAWESFYSLDQGSRLIPYAWAKALKLPNGGGLFLDDALVRYGYLPNPASPTPGLPVGFTVSSDGVLGPTCAACHTREIDVNGEAYRIDGGPALADLWKLWGDLDVAVGKVVSDPATFTDFAKTVLDTAYSPEKEAALHKQVQDWHVRHHAITEHGLPAKPWGAGRLDAVGMILNRVVGLDIAVPPKTFIEGNIKPADAPVRPPFLWNAPRQDKTQWPGFADNGDAILALSRNLGQVYGVFGKFAPKADPTHLLGFNYIEGNSANFPGLLTLEHLVEQIGPPKWRWALDDVLAAKGEKIFLGKGGCASCHAPKPGQPRLLNKDTWATPIKDVGTDAREYLGLARTADTGALKGAFIPLIADKPLEACDRAVSVLGIAVRGAILQQFIPVRVSKSDQKKADLVYKLAKPMAEGLKGAFQIPQAAAPPLGKPCDPPAPNASPKFPYEARVLQGIWAAAPYLHNGSVPTLAELLKPEKERVNEFKVGPAYDIANVGLAVEQLKSTYTMKSNCDSASDRMSGDSHCGHSYGVDLPAEDKRALLEYLKKL